MKPVKCACGGWIAPTWDPINGIARMKCSNPSHGQEQSEPANPRRRTPRAPEGELLSGNRKAWATWDRGIF